LDHPVSTIGLNTTSNNAQVSRTSQVSTSQETAADGDVKVPLKAQCVCHSKESVYNLWNVAFYVRKNMCVNYFYSPGSVCIESSSVVS